MSATNIRAQGVVDFLDQSRPEPLDQFHGQSAARSTPIVSSWHPTVTDKGIGPLPAHEELATPTSRHLMDR